MALRPYWSGTLRLSLVSLNVAMYSALDASRKIAFHEIYRETGERVRHQLMAGDAPVERSDIVKGYEVAKGEYVTFEPDEIKDLKIPSSKMLDIARFVPADSIDAIYFDTPYYLAPESKRDQDTFAVMRDALRESKVVGLGQIVIAGRERLCAIKPCGPGMMLETLHYADEIRRSAPYFDDIREVDAHEDEIDLARELIRRKTGKFEPEQFRDHYADALQELVDARVEHRAPHPAETERAAPRVVNLMDALRKSLSVKDAANEDARPAAKSPKAPEAKLEKTPAKRRKAG
ncbi:MAG: non-homologous end joining protein Ku [Asticcacaulis sp.]